jgi:hypothetical protein
MKAKILHSDWPEQHPVGQIQEFIKADNNLGYYAADFNKPSESGGHYFFAEELEILPYDAVTEQLVTVGTQPAMRTFDTGATRSNDAGKLDYEGFLSPLVLERYAQYLHKHRVQADGKLRDSDNWQKGMPKSEYMKSAWRHFMDWWKSHRGASLPTDEEIEDSICALLFNASGYLYEHLYGKAEAKANAGK